MNNPNMKSKILITYLKRAINGHKHKKTGVGIRTGTILSFNVTFRGQGCVLGSNKWFHWIQEVKTYRK